MSEKVIIYTDGACSGNPGPGGWGVVLQYGLKQKTLSGFEALTTNNRMELMAAIFGLEKLKENSNVIVYTDSNYVKNGITKWIFSWKEMNWKTKSRSMVKNVDLWQRLDSISQKHTIEWCWVKGHSGCEGNELADQLARQAILNALN